MICWRNAMIFWGNQWIPIRNIWIMKETTSLSILKKPMKSYWDLHAINEFVQKSWFFYELSFYTCSNGLLGSMKKPTKSKICDFLLNSVIWSEKAVIQIPQTNRWLFHKLMNSWYPQYCVYAAPVQQNTKLRVPSILRLYSACAAKHKIEGTLNIAFCCTGLGASVLEVDF